MSIRLRLTLLYTLILALTLVVFGAALYTIQAQDSLNALQRDLRRSGETLTRSLGMYLNPVPLMQSGPPPPRPQQTLTGEQTFKDLREREIARVLDIQGNFVASPPGGAEEALPLSAAGLQALQNRQEWWEDTTVTGEHLLIYNRPVIVDDEVQYIAQVARPLTERDRALATLSRTLVVAGLLTIVAAFGIGWVLAGVTLRPIHHITRTAQAIGRESDFTRRVNYTGPNDEIGQLATTFNTMLSQLQEAYQRVSQALSLQRRFVADVSHELRTPLTTVRGNLALLRRDPPLPAEEQTDILTDLVEESDRLIRLVNNLLILARADAGHNLAREPIPLAPVVAEVCRQARHLDQQREIAEAIPDVTVLGDRDALKQVLLILLDNALKHSQGTITITAEAVGTQVALRVRDHGPGIAPEVLEHVFDRFYRGPVDATIPGFGLGLSIAKSLVESLEGTIGIESQPGSGCTVQVRLPQGPAIEIPPASR